MRVDHCLADKGFTRTASGCYLAGAKKGLDREQGSRFAGSKRIS